MLSRFSVKKPYTIIVLVIVALILGGVSLTRMKTDLLPEMNLPYLAVITTDPGASAEKVEKEVTNVLEGSLAKVNGVKGIQSSSSDNFSLIFLEFEDGTDMDSAMVKVSSAVNTVSSLLPEKAGTPSYMEISMDMLASMYVAVNYEGKDIYQLSSFVEEQVVPEIMRQNGVADVSTVGAIERTVEVRLSDSKIEDVNNKILASVNDKLYDAKKAIDEGEAQLANAEDQIKQQQAALEKTQSDTANSIGGGISEVTSQLAAMQSNLSTMQAQAASLQAQITQMEQMHAPESQIAPYRAQLAQIQAAIPQIQDGITQLTNGLAQAEAGEVNAASGFGSGTAQLASALSTLEANKAELKNARSEYESARDQAIKSANVNALVKKETLSQILTAQDFSMPAGYLGNAGNDSDDQMLLRVGTDIATVDDLKTLSLLYMDGVGDIRLDDVADITVVDNSGDAFMKLNGKEGVLLSVFKTSSANTSDVSAAVNSALDKLEAEHSGLELVVMSDQADLVAWFIKTILQSLILGAILAVVVLAVFLRDWKPTVIVAFSIPFSVLCSLIIMYFTGIQLNIMSMGGISLATGMLVDNSIIVLENIYRMRSRGVPAARAAVQGAKQIAGPAIASTLTTICVFVPIVFTTGLVNELMLPFALVIAYVLCASLVVALTLVPTLSSLVFKNYVPRPARWFDRVQDAYANSIDWVLRHKIVPLAVSVVLLVGAVVGVVQMGIILIPSMASKTATVMVTMPDDCTKEQAYQNADTIMDAAMSIDGVADVGAMDGSASISMLSTDAGGAASKGYRSMTFYLTTKDNVNTEQGVKDILKQLDEKTKDLNCTVVTDMTSSDSMSSMVGSGLSLTLEGPDPDELNKLSEQVMEKVKEVPGYTEVDNGMEKAKTELTLVVDRDALTKEGLTVAQLYADLAGRLNTTADSTSLEIDNTSVTVQIVDETKVMTEENLMDTVIESTNQQTGETKSFKLSEVARVEEGKASRTIGHIDGNTTVTVTAEVEDGYNNMLLYRDLQPKLDQIDVPEGYKITSGGEIENINTMLDQMLKLLLLGFVLIYLIMVAQFQSLLSPFIIILTVPLAFTGGFFGLLFAGEQLSMLGLFGFAVLMGTVVNNGIVFVDFVNRLRIGGLTKHDALVATGRTRMRPILMTALTTILAMLPMVFSPAIGSSMQRGMAIVVVGGLLYATFMTLYVVPVMYDLLYRRQPRNIDVGDDLDDEVDDAQEYLDQMKRERGELPPAYAGAHAAAPTPVGTVPPLVGGGSGVPTAGGHTVPPIVGGNAPAPTAGGTPGA